MPNKDIQPFVQRNGVSPSYLWLQKGPWTSVLAFLIHRFPNVSKESWQSRMARGDVMDENGTALIESSAYFWGRRLFYYREIEAEAAIPVKEEVLFEDEHILVADKPHFLPVIPSGRFLNETLLVRLKNKLQLHELSPIHRLDRETAGVIIFSKNAHSRGAYQSLFQFRAVHKCYEALAPNLDSMTSSFFYRSKMVPGHPFFSMQEVAGTPNSETHIERLEQIGTISRYRLRPLTGRKHQLRVHLAALGIPILNDNFYPAALPCQADDLSRPLQLLAQSIEFTDPITKEKRFFESRGKLVINQRDVTG